MNSKNTAQQKLEYYKEKFEPVWRSRFIAFDGSSSFARASRDVALLIGGGWRGVLGFKG